MSISFSGLASGLGTAEIISALVEVKRQPIYNLEDKRTLYESQKSAYSQMESHLSTLLSAINDLDNNTDFASLAGTSSKEESLTATAGSTATQGSYDITINTLAAAQKSLSQGFDSATDNVGTGTFDITVGGETTSVELGGTGSLSDLAFSINQSDAGVTASILYDGNESGGYHLMLTAEETGTDAAFSLDTSGLSGGTPPTFTTTCEACNAEFVIDGTLTVTSQSNDVSTAVQGVTLNLLAADTEDTIHLEVGVDDEALQEKIQTFVSAYNDLFTYIDEQTDDEATLNGDSLARSVSSRIRMAMTTALGDGDITTLYQIGISQEEGGLISFDSSEFTERIAEDYSGVRDLFVGTETEGGPIYLLGLAIDDMVDSTDGMFKLRSDSLVDRMDDIDSRIERYETSIEKYEATLSAKFTAMENMIATLSVQSGYLNAL